MASDDVKEAMTLISDGTTTPVSSNGLTPRSEEASTNPTASATAAPQETPSFAAFDDWDVSAEELKKRTLEELRAYLKQKNQSIRGNKIDLIQRIVDLSKTTPC